MNCVIYYEEDIVRQVQCRRCDCVMDLAGSYVSEEEVETGRSSGRIGSGSSVSVYNVFGKGGPKVRVGKTSSRSLDRKSYKTIKIYYCQDCAMVLANNCCDPGQLIVDKRSAPALPEMNFSKLSKTLGVSDRPARAVVERAPPNAQLVYQAKSAAVYQEHQARQVAIAKEKQEAYKKLSAVGKFFYWYEHQNDTVQGIVGLAILVPFGYMISRFF